MKIEKLTSENVNALLAQLAGRSPAAFPKEEKAVQEIIESVRKEGDAAVLRYTEAFDHVQLTPETLEVGEEEIREAYEASDPSFVGLIGRAASRIRAFHEKQKEEGWFMTEADGSMLGQRVIPLERAGLYAPGGKAAYPSSVLMNVIPAVCAGVDEIILCTPCGRDGRVAASTLVAAKEAGVHRVFKIGGAQAIAAMAFGTETIPKVDKITGPGNIYVALAKRAVYGHVSIDSVAGPSEILVLADDSPDPKYVAADLLSQAEHDEMASAILITTSERMADAVLKEIEALLPTLSRETIIRSSLEHFGRILIAENMDDAVRAANAVASEHMEILTEEPFAILPKIRNAGAVFLGPYSSEPLGDYYAGPNHVLPTSGTARFFSALSVRDFVKTSSVVYFSEDALRKAAGDIEQFAYTEGLSAHARSIEVRFGHDQLKGE